MYDNGKAFSRSTRTANLKIAERLVQEELHLRFQLLRKQPKESWKLSAAIVREVDRIVLEVSKRQAERVRSTLLRFLAWSGDLSIERSTTGLLADFQRHRVKAEKRKRSTVKKDMVYIACMLRENGINVALPKALPAPDDEVREFAKEEIGRFFRACQEYSQNDPGTYFSLFLLMLVTGARPADLVPSKRSGHTVLLATEIDAVAGTVTIRSSKARQFKSGVKRVCPLDGKVLEMVLETAASTPGDKGFPEMRLLSRVFDRILSKAGIPKRDSLGRKLAAHSFRHTYATLMAEAVGNNSFVLKQALGHKSLATTDRYVHPTAPAQVIDIGDILCQKAMAE